jgi:hypothetical protein
VTFSARELAAMREDIDDEMTADDVSIAECVYPFRICGMLTHNRAGSTEMSNADKSDSDSKAPTSVAGSEVSKRRPARAGAGTGSRARLFRRMTMQYALALGIYAVVSIVGLVVILVLEQRLLSAASEVNLAGKREWMAHQVHFLAREIVVNDARSVAIHAARLCAHSRRHSAHGRAAPRATTCRPWRPPCLPSTTACGSGTETRLVVRAPV